MNGKIPRKYLDLWEPFKTNETLFHLTTHDKLQEILENGLEPRDPSPKHWAGMKAIFMALPSDTLYIETQKHVVKHVSQKGPGMVRLHIKTGSDLYRSLDPKRTFQVISLDKITPDKIIKVEKLD